MSDNGPGPPKGGGPSTSPPIINPSSLSSTPAQSTATPIKIGGSDNGGSPSPIARQRSYEEIISDAHKEKSSSRIILQFRLSKLPILKDGSATQPKSLTNDQFGDFLFDELKIQSADCLELDLSGRWDTKELILKSDADVTKIADRYVYHDHQITVSKVSGNITKVTFKNVPPSVPDEEIIHLIKAYGEPVDGIVHREQMTLGTSRKSIRGATRYVEMRLQPGKFLKNYYWMEGPLPEDTGRRVTVLHPSQPQQCSHCFLYARSFSAASSLSSVCPGGGNGKICESRDTPRAKMAIYMADLRKCDRYVPLKTLHMERMTSNFPPLITTSHPDGVPGDQAEENLDSNAFSMPIGGTTPKSPIEQIEEQVQLLQTQVIALNNQLREEQARSIVSNEEVSRSRKLRADQDFVKKCNERRFAELLSGTQEISWDDDKEGKHLVASYSRCLDTKSLSLDAESNTLKTGCFDFMENIEKQCIFEHPEKKEEKLEKLKTAIINAVSNSRTRRASARERSNSVKRDREEEGDEIGLSRPRLGSQTSISSAVSASALESEDSSPPTS